MAERDEREGQAVEGSGRAGGNGLSDARDGYRLVSGDTALPAGRRAAYRFTVHGPDGR